jgi:hypothetical protein
VIEVIELKIFGKNLSDGSLARLPATDKAAPSYAGRISHRSRYTPIAAEGNFSASVPAIFSASVTLSVSM